MSRLNEKLVKEAQDNPTAGTLHSLGVMELVWALGHKNQENRSALDSATPPPAATAVSTLRAASLEGEPSASLLNDLAVAHWLAGDQADDWHSKALALDTIERAYHVDPLNADVRFNRALFLSQWRLWRSARAAWQEAEVGNDFEWSEEITNGLLAARKKIDEERSIPTFEQEEADLLRAWCEPLLQGKTEAANQAAEKGLLRGREIEDEFGDAELAGTFEILSQANGVSAGKIARAVEQYVAMRQAWLDSSTEYEGRIRILEKVATDLEDFSLPIAARATLLLAVQFIELNRYPEAISLTKLFATGAKDPKRQLLEARASWLLGLALFNIENPVLAQKVLEDAVETFRTFKDPESTAAVLALRATASDTLGDPGTTWQLVAGATDLFEKLKPTHRHISNAYGAYQSALGQGLRHLALAFSEEGLALSREGTAKNEELLSGLSSRARTQVALGRPQMATEDIFHLKKLIEASLRPEELRVFWLLPNAEKLVHENPSTALSATHDLVVNLEDSGLPALLPEAYALRSLALASNGSFDEAMLDLERAIAVLEGGRDESSDPFVRQSYFAQAAALYDRQLGLELAKNGLARTSAKTDKQLELADRGRALSRTFVPREGGLIEPGATILYFTSLEDRILRWAVSNEKSEVTETVINQDDLAKEIKSLNLAIQRSDQELIERHSAYLASQLIPADLLQSDNNTKKLIVVPDLELYGVPFELLPTSASGDLLIQRFAVSYAFDLNSALRIAARAEPQALHPFVIVQAGALPGAIDEAKYLDELHMGREVLLLSGDQATPASFLEAIPQARMMHIAAHAVANSRRPELSQFLLSPAGEGSGVLTARQILHTDLSALELVVLAGCRSARADAAQGEPLASSLAFPFVARGVPAVVASLWDVSDEATSELMKEFHRRMARGSSASSALREAKLSLLAHGDWRSAPRHWAAFVLFGDVAGE